MKKISIILIIAAFIASIFSCAGNGNGESPEQVENPAVMDAAQSPGTAGSSNSAPDNLTTEKWIAQDNTISAWFSEEQPENYSGVDIDIETMQIGKTADGKDIFALLRLPLKGTWLAGEVHSARLFLKVKENDAPASLLVTHAASGWDFSQTPCVEARALVDDISFSTAEIRQEEDGWISFDVTSCVRAWLDGDMQNNGFALFAENAGDTGVFVSGWAPDNVDIPYLEVSGAVGVRALDYGKFGYTEQPVPGAEIDEGGNCLSYALRDTEMIFIDDLNADSDVMNEIYRESGEDAVMDYFTVLVENYVEANKAGLQISRFQKIDAFDAPVQPEEEYRIAIRIGCKVFDGEVDLDGARNFDFHAWAQLNDGQWAQKFPLDTSEKIPCSGPGVSPEKYPWNAALQWSMARLNDYYTSKVVYFAVAKDTDNFTKHKTYFKEQN
ncbi:MAG: DNRLRE domain-containing protein [Syntrophomonadaceae bacterium]|nr:DNRLRE domain-containing protein [Syntrophomonadaceae bacterium]